MRIICIDYGAKRKGLAVTDPLKIIATRLTTIESKELIPFKPRQLPYSRNAISTLDD